MKVGSSDSIWLLWKNNKCELKFPLSGNLHHHEDLFDFSVIYRSHLCRSRSARPREEAEALQLFANICSGYGSDGGRDIGGAIVYCKRGSGQLTETAHHQVRVPGGGSGAAQTVFIQPPPVRYIHRVQIQVEVVAVEVVEVKPRFTCCHKGLIMRLQTWTEWCCKPVVYFLKGNGGGSGGGGGGGSGYGVPAPPSNYGAPPAQPPSNYGVPPAQLPSNYGAPVQLRTVTNFLSSGYKKREAVKKE
ncbi:hypothetical protein Ocin01_08940 [Orchesella cincta]|uniref:Uncharacterized protein n=1 Tax=Orchesella cincta TaxID=48709 RepID=A0A1D2MXG9_ORCCI|nr:hypothetical protein Ocin01_08940 [Orchesella cincta]